MKILIVTGLNLEINSSVNMANIAYIRGFVENCHSVDVIMPCADEADKDPSMIKPSGVSYFIYNRTSNFEKKVSKSVKDSFANSSASFKTKLKKMLRKLLSNLKQLTLKVFKKGDFYSYYNLFIKNIVKNSHDITRHEYDLLITISSPIVSHHIGEIITKIKGFKYKKWIQIWEDPWYYDLYTSKDKAILEEENRLLSMCDKVIYVSPITCMYQKMYFKSFSEKMSWQFLPCYNEIEYSCSSFCKTEYLLGYFGEYSSFVRDIRPLVEAVKDISSFKLVLCGNTDLHLEKHDRIIPKGRIPLHQVEQIQGECDFLIMLSNVKGGQIPGKLYQYAGTNKPIIFILDGTETEIEILLQTYKPYERFIFCENNEESIKRMLESISEGKTVTINKPVLDFSPRKICEKIIEEVKIDL